MKDDKEPVDGQEPDEQIVEKSMAERAKEVGRDGAYLEVDAKDLVASYRSGELQKAQIVVIKAARVELSDPADVKNLVQSVTAMAMQIAKETPPEYIAGMSDEQLSMWTFREIFTGGLS